MKLIIKKQIGKRVFHFEVEGANLYEVLMEKNKLSFPDRVAACGLCGSENLDLMARLAKNEKGKEVYKYVYIKCIECSGELTFGQRQDDNQVFFLRKENGQFAWKPVEKKQDA
jgi:hypothetical protein